MTPTNDVACNGLLEQAFGNPLAQLAGWLNDSTPLGFHLNVVGGFDPRPGAQGYINDMIAKGRQGMPTIYIGHSLGGNLAFDAANALKAAGIKSPLFVSIDSTDWGTNAAGIPQWSTVVLPPNTGEYFVPDNVATWLHFYQDGAPGGGIAQLAPGNETTILRAYHLPGENHISIVNCDPVRKAILAAVLKATA
jgi:hypothetical protein